MKCKKLKGNLLDLKNEDETTEFLKKFIKQQKYECYTAHQQMQEEELLRRRALNCWDRIPPVEVQRKREEIIKEVTGK